MMEIHARKSGSRAPIDCEAISFFRSQMWCARGLNRHVNWRTPLRVGDKAASAGAMTTGKNLSYQKLDTTIMVMKSAEDRNRCDAAYVLDGAMDRSVFAKRPMSPPIALGSVAPAQGLLVCGPAAVPL
jgi:hypothetical protein